MTSTAKEDRQHTPTETQAPAARKRAASGARRMYPTARIFLTVIAALTNVIALIVLVGSLQRAFVQGTGDLESSITVMGFLIGGYPIWRMSCFVVLGPEVAAASIIPKRRWLLLVGQAGFWGGTALVTMVLVPQLGRWNQERGLQAMQQQRYSVAIEYFRRSLSQLESSPSAHYALAETFEELGDPEEATRHYWLGIYSDEGFPAAAFNNLSILLLARGEQARALELLDLAEQRVAAELPDERWVQLGVISKNRAWAYFARGLYAPAEAHTEKALRFLAPSGSVSEYPEIFCLKALIARARERSGATSSSAPATRASERCTEGFGRKRDNSSQGAVRELYLQVLSGN